MDTDVPTASMDRREGEAVRNARLRIATLAESVGVHHPDYATGLNQLALLLIMQGDPASAEPLLREALEIRGTTLGDTHPDYATNLSSLGGLLWARGELVEAEPLLARAAEIRKATLGPGHPKTVVSRNSLEQLRQALAASLNITDLAPDFPEAVEMPAPIDPGATNPDPVALSDGPEPVAEVAVTVPESIGLDAVETAEAEAASAPPPLEAASAPEVATIPDPIEPHDEPTAPEIAAESAEEPEPATAEEPEPATAEDSTQDDEPTPDAGPSGELIGRLETLRGDFADLADALLDVAERLREGGTPVDEAVERRARDTTAAFRALVETAASHAREEGLDWPGDPAADADAGVEGGPRRPTDLDGLERSLVALEDARRERRAVEARRGAVLPALDRVACLANPTDADFGPLASCRAAVAALRERVASRPPDDWSGEEEAFRSGTHPVVALLGIVDRDDAVSDADWADWFDRVEGAYGTPLAVAAARARLVISAP